MPDFLDSVADADARMQERLEARLRDDAAQREGLAGSELCVDCDEPIPAKRRALLPYATRCVDCAAFEEMTARRPR